MLAVTWTPSAQEQVPAYRRFGITLGKSFWDLGLVIPKHRYNVCVIKRGVKMANLTKFTHGQDWGGFWPT